MVIEGNKTASDSVRSEEGTDTGNGELSIKKKFAQKDNKLLGFLEEEDAY
jgi:hypothetical protein